MSTFKLEYFPGRYLGETARLMFHYVGQEFEDVRISNDDWTNLKPEVLYGTLPILTVNNSIQIGQSMAIYHYLAKKFKLAGKTDEEMAQIEAIGEYFRDFMNKCLPFLIFDLFKHEGDREQKIKELLEVNIRQYCPVLVRILKKSKSDFFADSGITWVDFMISEYVDSLYHQIPHKMEDFPELLEHCKKIHHLPELQKYLSTRNWLPW